MNVRQVLNKLVGELPTSFYVSVRSGVARYPSSGKIKMEKEVSIGVYDSKGIYYENVSRWIKTETWAEALEKYEKLAKELGWK